MRLRLQPWARSWRNCSLVCLVCMVVLVEGSWISVLLFLPQSDKHRAEDRNRRAQNLETESTPHPPSPRTRRRGYAVADFKNPRGLRGDSTIARHGRQESPPEPKVPLV